MAVLLEGCGGAASTRRRESTDPASIRSVSPDGGPLAGGTALAIDGANFLGAVTVTVDGRPALDATLVDEARITCRTPAGAQPGAATVIVSCSLSGTTTAPDAFTYRAAPTVSGVSPSSGPRSGATPLTILGSGFDGDVSVSIGGSPATNIEVQSSSRITCRTPATSVSGPAAVVVSTGDGEATAPVEFQYNAPPAVAGVPAPGSGPRSGGTTIAIIGSGFDGEVTVLVGGVPASGVAVSGGTRITCVTPAANASGAVDVLVDCSLSGAAIIESGFVYNSLPAISAVTPAAGPIAGDTPVEITGTGFLGAVKVTIGGAEATNVVVSAGTRITCNTPAGVAGAADVTVTCSQSGAVTLPGGLRYRPPPTASAPSPAIGPQDGGTPITLLGANFFGAVAVTIGGAPATHVVVTGANQIDCRAPPASASGDVNVVVTCSESGSVTLAAAYRYRPRPTITLPVTPGSGLKSGGTTITITGTNFLGAVSVTLDGVPATGVAVTGGTLITCATPAADTSGPVALTVNSSTHGSVTIENAFSYIPVVTVSGALTPNNGTAQGGTRVAIDGANFGGAITVRFNSSSASNVVVTGGNRITCDTPAGTAGPATVIISSTTNGSVTLAGGYTYNPVPTIALPISPSTGPQAGTPITIRGTNFLGTVNVTIGSLPATSVLVTGGTTITCVAPAVGAPTAADVIVSSSTNGVANAPGAFVYNPTIAVTLSTVAPGNGSAFVALGDLNRDGRPDMVSASASGTGLGVLLGDGNGGFTPVAGSPFTLPNLARGLALADMDRDTAPDVIVSTDSGVCVLRNVNRDGTTFTLGGGSPLASGTSPGRLVVGDFNRNGRLDVAVCSGSDDLVRVFVGDGAGGLAPAAQPTVAVGDLPIDISAADLDNDGDVDLVVANAFADSVAVLLGDGTGAFLAAPGSPIAVGAQPRSVALADFDMDARLDLAVCNGLGNSVSVLRGNGAGGFTPFGPPLASNPAVAVAASDIDGNGIPDLIVSSGTLARIFAGQGGGAFAAPATFLAGFTLQTPAVGDVDRNGRPDLAIPNPSQSSVSLLLNGTAWIGVAQLANALTFGSGSNVSELRLGDFNGDGLVDVVGADVETSGGNFRLALATAPLSYAAPVTFTVTGSAVQDLEVADVNRDGRLDVIVSEFTARKVYAYLGDGRGGFPTVREVAFSSSPDNVALGDFNRDGVLDLIVAFTNSFQLLTGDGAGGFALSTTTSSTFLSDDIEVGDLNRDGLLDVVVSDFGVFRVFTFNGAVFSSGQSVSVDASNLLLADFNRDGILDLAVGGSGSGSTSVRSYTNNGSGTFALAATTTVSSGPQALAVLDLNRDGIPDIAVGNRFSASLNILRGNGAGAFPVVTTFNAVSGTRAVNVGDLNRDGLPDVVAALANSSGFRVLQGR